MHVFSIPASKEYENSGINNQSKIINEQLKNYFKNNTIMEGARILLVGHSTGGVAAYETYRVYKNKYNITGIITASTPWQGTDITINGPKNFNWLFYLVFRSFVKKIYGKNKSESVKEITPESGYLKSLEESLKDCKIPIWAIGGKTEYYKKLLSTGLSKALFGINSTEDKIFGSCNHDGIINLSSQIASKSKKIQSIIINEPANHSAGIKEIILRGMKKVIKKSSFIISKKDAKKILSIEHEPSITETSSYLFLIKKFIEKYGLYPNRQYPEDSEIIKTCQLLF